jgi:hypothetical protein
MEDFRFGSYYICRGTKPELDLAESPLATGIEAPTR